jgi:hypothetical protein
MGSVDSLKKAMGALKVVVATPASASERELGRI